MSVQNFSSSEREYTLSLLDFPKELLQLVFFNADRCTKIVGKLVCKDLSCIISKAFPYERLYYDKLMKNSIQFGHYKIFRMCLSNKDFVPQNVLRYPAEQ